MFFDTLAVKVDDKESLKKRAEEAGVNFYYGMDDIVLISLNETTKNTHVKAILEVFGKNNFEPAHETGISNAFIRITSYLQHPVYLTNIILKLT